VTSGLAQPGLQAAVFAFGQFTVGEQAEAFLEAQVVDVEQSTLLAQRLVHA